MEQHPSVPSGLPNIPHLRWGSHLAHFFGSGAGLRDVLVPYFKAGLENNERCLWLTGEAFNAEEARSALRSAVPDLDRRERGNQIEIANGDAWYASGGMPQPSELIRSLMQRGQEALDAGHAGLRTSGNCGWVGKEQWPDFLEYERLVHENVQGRPMVCICSYCMDQLREGGRWDVMDHHDLALGSVRPAPPGALMHVAAGPQELRRAMERQKRSFDLAMTASNMATWRYTFADNVCIYDENAQRLYGLDQARFLHDPERVRQKFHPDDVDLMWSRVARALDPEGDGRYEVEYRVRQLDGSWRWLSAWGLVEFDEGPTRTPVAIAGASRDLTERKKAEETERLLRDELGHRVKNTLAMVQAISSQTLRAARDLPSAREALNLRIQSLAKAHDLLTSRAWTNANLRDVVKRSLDAFSPVQVDASGTEVEVSAKHALALSLALHELATNATKYGALSCPEGRVSVRWSIDRGRLNLEWEESGGPPVFSPSHKGFGSRLLEEVIVSDLDGDTKLHYHASGLRCTVTAQLSRQPGI